MVANVGPGPRPILNQQARLQRLTAFFGDDVHQTALFSSPEPHHRPIGKQNIGKGAHTIVNLKNGSPRDPRTSTTAG